MAGAYNQIKDLYKMQKEAREMQKKMKAITIKGLSDDELVEITIDGTQEIIDIYIDDQLINIDGKKELVKRIKQSMKDAQKKLQKELMKGMDINQIKNMLNG